MNIGLVLGCVMKPRIDSGCWVRQAAIANAATLEEVARLEEALRTGHMPSQLAENGVNGDATAMEEG